MFTFKYTFCLFRFKAVAAKSKLDLVNEGFTEFTIEDFHNTVSILANLNDYFAEVAVVANACHLVRYICFIFCFFALLL